ncbi:hypothetical protein LY15_003087 [Prauserella flava]|nr:hypothetical protein [Prauserella flava]MCR3734819.1 hypothetical protein [Prauserella salsuginis]
MNGPGADARGGGSGAGHDPGVEHGPAAQQNPGAQVKPGAQHDTTAQHHTTAQPPAAQHYVTATQHPGAQHGPDAQHRSDTQHRSDAQHDAGAEPHHQRLTRNVNELLGELRVAQAGVQILFGFLLAVAFTAQFREASGFEKILHLVTVLFAAAATAMLTAPAAWHRMLFRAGRRQAILRVGNRLVIAGLVCLAIAVTLTVGLIAKVVYGPVLMGVALVLVGGLFSTLWFFIPTKL